MIELSEDLGVYVDGAKTYHRVSTVLRDVFGAGYEGVDEDVVANAARRGREVEALCYEYAVKGYVEAEVSEDCLPRIEAFDRFWTKYKPEYVAHQKTVYLDDIAGTLDLILRIDGVITIPDIKCTAQVDKKWPIQLGAYASMTTDTPLPAVAILHLNPSLNKAGYKLREYDTAIAMRWWRTTLEFWRMKREALLDAQRQKESA